MSGLVSEGKVFNLTRVNKQIFDIGMVRGQFFKCLRSCVEGFLLPCEKAVFVGQISVYFWITDIQIIL